MIAWWVALPSWAKKACLYAVLALAVLYALRLWGNRQWSAGEQAGRQAGLADAEKALLERKKQAEAAIATERQQLSADRAEVDAKLAETARNRQAIQSTLNRIISASTGTRDERNATLDRLSGLELDAAIREQCARLAASQ